MYSNYNSCVESRGEVFNLSQSADWDYLGIFEFGIEEQMGFGGNAYYGYDRVILGDTGPDAIAVNETTVGSFAVSDFWLGRLGLNPKPTNWSDSDAPWPSFMTKLKAQESIPSISFGYTAGAPYRMLNRYYSGPLTDDHSGSSGIAGSLTLGGYDQSRFEANDVEFDFAPEPTGDTVVAIQSITTRAQNSTSSVELLPAPIYALIDTTISQIWLPLDACQAFEREFGLTWDETYNLYLVNSSLHDSLLARNAQVNFTIGTTASGLNTTTISFPYAAFDMTAQSPYQGLADRSSYFPLRRAANDTQYRLGRAFMQEAYITVDYERAKFNVSQCIWTQDNGNVTEIIIIEPAPASENSGYSGASSGVKLTTPGTPSGSSSAHLSGGAIGGIVAGSVIGIVALIGLATWYIRRDRKRKVQAVEEEKGDESSPSRDSRGSISHTIIGVGEKGTTVFPKAELEGSTVHDDPRPALRPASSLASPTTQGCSTWSSTQADPTSPGVASEAGGLEIYEMAGDMPDVAQADGRTITEKEMMMRREEMYNGVDRSNPVTPTVEANPALEKRGINPGDLIIKSEIREGGIADTRPPSRFSFE